MIQNVNEQSKPVFSGNSNETEKTIETRELSKILETSLSQIPLDYRMVFSLREVSGLNVAETAELMNISEANVKVRLNRSKAMLRREIEKNYAPTELFEFNLIYCDTMVNNVMKRINEL